MSPKRKTYIACETIDFLWNEKDVEEFVRLWNNGVDVRKLKRRYRRNPDEVALLIFDLSRKGRIMPRANGLHGIN